MGFMICPNCGMLKSNCICGNSNKSNKDKNHKINKEVKVDSPPKGSTRNKKFNNRFKSPKKNKSHKKPIIRTKKSDDEFKKKLKSINHYIDDDEKNKLNPSNNDHNGALIDIHNLNFIKNEQNEISKEFNADLRKYTTMINEDEINKFKIKYTKDYKDYFTSLKMENSIRKFNRDLKKKHEQEISAEFQKIYSSSNKPISEDKLSDLISKYPDEDWNQWIKDYNRQYFKNLYNKTEDEVYYLNDYIRKDAWDHIDSKVSQTSKEILKYKKGFSKCVNKFANEIMDFIVNISNYLLDEDVRRIFLVSIPSSTRVRNENSSMKKTIGIIEDNYNMDKNKFNNKEIINFSDALLRIENVKTAHMNPNDRPKYGDHRRTIEFRNNKKYDFEDSIIILLDDITTTGTIMEACEDILAYNNIEKDKIYKLAIAATV